MTALSQQDQASQLEEGIVVLRKSQTRTVFILFLFFLSISIKIYGASGDLDPAFGNGGKIVTSLVSVADSIHRLRLQPDGKILILTSDKIDQTLVSRNASIYRFNPDGSYDASFGTSGRITYSGLRDFAVLPDGRLVVAINYGRPTTGYIKRFSSDGQLDLTFGSGGDVEIASKYVSLDARRIQVDQSGKIFVAAATANYTLFAKLNYDGSFDNSFGDNGVAYGYGTAL